MDLVTNNAALHGFAPDIHDVYATVEDLELKRGWRPYNTLALPDDPPLAPAVTTWISGKARLRNDKLAVIGSKAQSASQLKFSLSSFKDWAARSAEWAEELAKYGDPLDALKEASREPDPDRLWQYTSNVYKAFTARPPTLTLRHHDRNEEIGITEGWDLHCLVPGLLSGICG